MKIELKKITVRDLVKGYIDDGEGGVRGYGGKLDIRPPFQREFIYKNEQRDAVIETINQGFPLNVMYWAVREDGTYEVIDGQQRTISIAEYVEGHYSLAFDLPEKRAFFNLEDDEQARILNYKLQVYICEGTASEKLAWFRIINIAGERLTNQELRNAVYAGPWVSNAKRHFSRKGAACPAYAVGNRYVNGRADRQEYLETAIKWHKKADQSIEEYMSTHQRDPTATSLWSHFQTVINRTQALFPNYRREMKGVDWGTLHRKYMQDEKLDPNALEVEVAKMMSNSDVQRKPGIYAYVFDRDEKHLNIRKFDNNMKREAFEKSNGLCPSCNKTFKIEQMEADHITPWSKGGRTVAENCQMLCTQCNRQKSSK